MITSSLKICLIILQIEFIIFAKTEFVLRGLQQDLDDVLNFQNFTQEVASGIAHYPTPATNISFINYMHPSIRDDQRTIQPSVFVVSQQLAISSINQNNIENYATSDPCPPGTTVYLDTCTPCPIGTFSHNSGSTQCTSCPDYSWTLHIGSTDCEAFLIGLSLNSVIIVIVPFVFVMFLCIFYSTWTDIRIVAGRSVWEWKSLALSVHLILPTIDKFTDLPYLLTSVYANSILFFLMISCYIVPIFLFIKRLIEYRAIPKVYFPNRILWLCIAKYDQEVIVNEGRKYVKNVLSYAPHYHRDSWINIFNHERLNFVVINNGFTLSNNYENRLICPFSIHIHREYPYFVTNILLWIIYIILQILYIPLIFILCLIIQPILLIIWFFFGVFFLYTKVDCITTIWNIWFYYWTQNDSLNANPDELRIDTEILNSQFFWHFLAGAVPNLFIQAINNFLKNEWNILDIISFSLSINTVLNAMYTYIYHRCCGCCYADYLEIEDIPQVLSLMPGFPPVLILPKMKKSQPKKRNCFHYSESVKTVTHIQAAAF